MPPRNPTPIAQAYGMREKAWTQADNLYHTGDPALFMEAQYAAVYIEELVTKRYAIWQSEGGQSNWSPVDRYQDPPNEEQWPSIATRYEVLGGLQ